MNKLQDSIGTFQKNSDVAINRIYLQSIDCYFVTVKQTTICGKSETKFLFMILPLEKQPRLIMSILQSPQKLDRNLKQSSERKDEEFVDLTVEITVSDHTDHSAVQHKDTGFGIKDFEKAKEKAKDQKKGQYKKYTDKNRLKTRKFACENGRLLLFGNSVRLTHS